MQPGRKSIIPGSSLTRTLLLTIMIIDWRSKSLCPVAFRVLPLQFAACPGGFLWCETVAIGGHLSHSFLGCYDTWQQRPWRANRARSSPRSWP